MHNAVIIKSFEGVSIKVPIKTEQPPPSRHPSREGNRSRKKKQNKGARVGELDPQPSRPRSSAQPPPDPPPSPRRDSPPSHRRDRRCCSALILTVLHLVLPTATSSPYPTGLICSSPPPRARRRHRHTRHPRRHR